MATPRYLTKSRFKIAVECPTKLFYTSKRDEYRDTMADDDFLAMLAEGGYQVGALAKLRYPEGIEIHGLEHAKAEQETREYLAQESVILFEPAIRVGDFFIRIDILVKTGNRFELIEVKAKSYDSKDPEIEGKRGGINSKMLPYIQDVAFQKWVLQQAFPEAEITTALMMPDKARLASVDGVNQMFKIRTGERSCEVLNRIPEGVDAKSLAENLLAKVGMDQYVERILSNPLGFPGGPASFDEAACRWAEAYRDDQRIDPEIGAHCGKCQFKALPGEALKSGFHECWKLANGWQDKDFADGTVLDIWNFRGKQRLIDAGKFKIDQVTHDDLGVFSDGPEADGLSDKQRQWVQVGGIPNAYDHGGFYFDSVLTSKEMKQWKYPYHFIDFETSAVALPFFKDMRPYESVAFQFSHHIMESDGTVRHADEFLCTEPGEFPNYQFARELKKVLENDNGTVFMWHHHENNILSAIIRQLQEDPAKPEGAEQLIGFLSKLVKEGERAMYDLCVLAKKGFFHSDTKGSSSIKKVLPAILKVSGLLINIYSQPVYGAPGGIPSHNFSCDEGFTWIETAEDGAVIDPYVLLKKYAQELLPNNLKIDPEEEIGPIAEGGAAATAYARLQFEDMDAQTREGIKSALLRYCELDTLAMVMIVQAWQGFIE